MRTLTVTAALAAAAATLAGCGNLDFGTKEESRSYTAPAGVTALKINGAGSRVEVITSDVSAVKVDERLRWSNDDNKPKAERSAEGDTLTLSARCHNVAFGYTRCGVDYRVQIPRDLPVEVDNTDGPIVASGLGGTVKLHNRNGSIKVTDMRATSVSIGSRDGSVDVSGRATTADLRTSNGSITADDLTGDRLKARARDGHIRLSGSVKTADLETWNGSINATDLAGERVAARTRDGSVELDFSAPPAAVQARTHNGSVRLWLPGGHGYAITGNSHNGSRRIDPAVHQDSASARHIELDTRDGGIRVEATGQRS